MKRWAIVVAVLYLLVLVVLTAPGLLVAFPENKMGMSGVVDAYTSWGYWVFLAVLAISQFALLAVPVRIASRRPVTRGALWPTILAGGFAAGLLALGAFLSILAFLLQDEPPGGDDAFYVCVAVGMVSWAVWAFVLRRASKTLAPDEVVTRQRRELLKGSILELLIAVPTHIVARHRDNCCADMMTFFGLVFGVAVMLFAYGPAVFFLFAERWRRLHPETPGNQQ
jgi:hypothetical protein